ncbi:PH domain-containing protein [Streptomyces sp. RS10V-4]|uniref:PH domain-containing protein n=1 Tax=Streptomyces rhizoryzae TaxID=2932493 RepID=UPI00200429B2|nr:PH domain-containing protein [Streptomyces rhizoryzae]MCK7626003.1 PH domain-containing protein [Streptomyces rhizoryzae]
MSAPASPESPLPGLPVTFRPTRTRAVLCTVGIAQLAALTAIAVLLPELSGGERISFVATGVLVGAVLLLLSRPKVVARQEGVTVVNLTTRRELAWAQVLRVNLRAGDPWVHLDLADGTSLPAMGIQPGIARDQAIRDARALRDLVEIHGAVDHTAR